MGRAENYGAAMVEEERVHTDDLIRGFLEVGVADDDVLFFHSSLKSFGRVEGGAEAVIDSALVSVGAHGTVMVPTFVQQVGGERANYMQRKAAWDIETSPSDVGHITEVFRKRSDSFRSDDCCNSLAAIGHQAREVMARHRTAKGRASPWEAQSYGHGSPWDWLVSHNALYLLMGVDFSACSILHYVQALWVEHKYGSGPNREGLTWPNYDFTIIGKRFTNGGLLRRTVVGKSTWQAFRVEPGVKKALEVLEAEPALITEVPLRLWREERISAES